jgi:hypothetical protein
MYQETIYQDSTCRGSCQRLRRRAPPSATAKPAPMPPDAPVTTATRPSSAVMVGFPAHPPFARTRKGQRVRSRHAGEERDSLAQPFEQVTFERSSAVDDTERSIVGVARLRLACADACRDGVARRCVVQLGHRVGSTRAARMPVAWVRCAHDGSGGELADRKAVCSAAPVKRSGGDHHMRLDPTDMRHQFADDLLWLDLLLCQATLDLDSSNRMRLE